MATSRGEILWPRPFFVGLRFHPLRDSVSLPVICMSSAEAAKADGNAAWNAGDNDNAIKVRGLIGRRAKTNWAANFD